MFKFENHGSTWYCFSSDISNTTNSMHKSCRVHYFNSQNIIIYNIKHQKFTPSPVFWPYDLDLKKMSDIKVELLQSYRVCWKNKMLRQDIDFFLTFEYIILRTSNLWIIRFPPSIYGIQLPNSSGPCNQDPSNLFTCQKCAAHLISDQVICHSS